MSEPVNSLMLEFLTWVAARSRSYDDAMAAWQSHCPRQTIWEDAIIGGLIEITAQAGDHRVVLTARGEALFHSNDTSARKPSRAA